MKVTVCFENVRVIVPCGDGDLLVKELIEKAVIRYKKAVGKSNDSWVTVQSLKTCSDGGILDPDDHLNDVVDDREQLTAIYEEQPVSHLHNNGDGASASSVGTSSPDIFQSNNVPSGASNGDFKGSALSDNDVIVTLEDVPSGPGLTVRRGSEPALVGLGEEETSSGFAVKPETPIVHKRWATFGNDTEFNSSTPKKENGDSDFLDPKKRLQPRWSSTGHNKLLAPKFFRDPYRQSLGNRPDMFKWFEAQERQEERLKDAQDGREEPVGGSIEKETNSNVAEKELEIIVTLKNDGEPLGIHVVPDYDDDDKETGLLLQRIEPGSKVSRDGRLKMDDRIIEINGSNLMGISFDRAQEIFRNAMKTNEIQLKVLKSNPPPLPKMPPPLYPKPTFRNRTSPNKPSPLTLPPTNPDEPKGSDNADDDSKNDDQKDGYDDICSSTSSGKSGSDEKPSSNSSLTENSGTLDDNSVPLSPSKKVPPAVPARHPTTALSTKDRNMFSASTNTRRIGKKHAIQLQKGSNGLGFSITSRDNPTGGSVPIYIKNILPKGAAVEDGRLKPGDRLLEVNGTEMSGKTQTEAVTILRNTKPGSMVSLLVSRQCSDEPPPKPARENLDKKPSSRPSSTSPAILVDHGDTSPIPDASSQDYFTFDIALNETSSAGLGVSVKGNTNPSETGANRDLGIFVKAIINGGAASKDGRLNVNDQLIEINGDSLLGLTNQDAMETLRQAMRSIDTVNSHIRLVIARHSDKHASSPLPSLNSVSINNSNHNSSFSDETESVENGQNADNIVNNKFFNCQTTDSSKNIENANLDENGNNSDVIMVPNNERTKPVVPHIERLRGGHGSSLNNDSYNRAVHSSFEDSSLTIDSKHSSPIPERKNSNSSTESKYSLAKTYQNQGGMRSLTVNPPEQETVLIEEDSYEQDDGYPPVFADEDSHQSSGSHHSQKLEAAESYYYRREELPRKPEQQSHHHHHHPNHPNHHHHQQQQSRPSNPNHPPPLPPHPTQHHPSQDYSPNPPHPHHHWNEETMLNQENSELNPLSPDFDPNLAFQREGFGRQSMSEKRRGHHDARYSDFYHLAKNNRDDRVSPSAYRARICRQMARVSPQMHHLYLLGYNPNINRFPNKTGKQGLVRAGSMESLIGNKVNSGTKLHDDMSGRGMHSDMSLRKRSSSMESLPTPDAAFENQGPLFWAPDRAARARTCNESFRAAVDRSYNAPHIIQNMETLEEENSDNGSNMGHGQLPPHVHRPVPHKDNSLSQEAHGPPPPPPPVTKANKKKERDNRKSGGIFKGIFKFGKSNKEDKTAANKEHQAAEKENSGKQKNDKPLPEVLEMDRNWKNPRADKERPPDHPKSPYLAPRTPAPRQRPGYRDPHYTEPYAQNVPRTDKIQQLREEHQRRHQERQGRYPLEDQEEMHERHLQEMERRKFNNQNQHPPPQLPYPEAEYAIVNKIRHQGGRPNPHERMNYQEKSHAPPYVPPYTPQPNGDERFYPPDYPNESHPKHPPPYPAGSREGWHNNGYRSQPPRPQPRHHRDNPHYKPQDNSQSSHEPWLYIRPGGQSAPPSWPHSIPVESPAATGDIYDYHSNGRYDYADPTYAVIPGGRRTPNSSANV